MRKLLSYVDPIGNFQLILNQSIIWQLLHQIDVLLWLLWLFKHLASLRCFCQQMWVLVNGRCPVLVWFGLELFWLDLQIDRLVISVQVLTCVRFLRRSRFLLLLTMSLNCTFFLKTCFCYGLNKFDYLSTLALPMRTCTLYLLYVYDLRVQVHLFGRIVFLSAGAINFSHLESGIDSLAQQRHI